MSSSIPLGTPIGFAILSLCLLSGLACDSRSQRPMELPRETRGDEAKERILAWLHEVRFQEADDPRSATLMKQPTYEAWLEEGKAFIGSNEVIILAP